MTWVSKTKWVAVLKVSEIPISHYLCNYTCSIVKDRQERNGPHDYTCFIKIMLVQQLSVPNHNDFRKVILNMWYLWLTEC